MSQKDPAWKSKLILNVKQWISKNLFSFESSFARNLTSIGQTIVNESGMNLFHLAILGFSFFQCKFFVIWHKASSFKLTIPFHWVKKKN